MNMILTNVYVHCSITFLPPLPRHRRFSTSLSWARSVALSRTNSHRSIRSSSILVIRAFVSRFSPTIALPLSRRRVSVSFVWRAKAHELPVASFR